MEEADDGTSCSSERAQRSVVCSMAMVSGGEAEGFDFGAEVNAEGPGVEKCIVLVEVPMLLCVAQVGPGYGDVVGIQ